MGPRPGRVDTQRDSRWNAGVVAPPKRRAPPPGTSISAGALVSGGCTQNLSCSDVL